MPRESKGGLIPSLFWREVNCIVQPCGFKVRTVGPKHGPEMNGPDTAVTFARDWFQALDMCKGSSSDFIDLERGSDYLEKC